MLLQCFNSNFGTNMKLFYKNYPGQGKNLIILHGLFGMLDNWHQVAKQLSAHFNVFTVDLRNHGQSPHDKEISFDLMAADVKELCDDLHLKSVIVMGHSLGGKTAMQFALSYPDKVEALLVLDIAPVKYAAGHTEIFEALFALDLTDGNRSRKEMDDALASHIKDFGIRQFLLKSLSREGTSYQWKFNLNALFENYVKLSDRIDSENKFDKPTLFVAGEKSNYIQPNHAAAIEKLFPQYGLVSISNAGHWVHADNPEALIDAVIKFLNP